MNKEKLKELEGKTIKEARNVNADNILQLFFTDGTTMQIMASTNGEYEVLDLVTP